MSVERTIACDRDGCRLHVRTATPPPYVPGSFLEVRRYGVDGRAVAQHFCSWECLMHHAAAQPAREMVPWSEAD